MADADALRDSPAPGAISSQPPSDAPSATPPGSTDPDTSVMSLVDHLDELRSRLFRCILAVVAGSIVGFYFAVPVRDFLLQPLPNGVAQVLGPGDGFAIQLRISIVIGIILAMPVLLYQIWSFVAPGLTPAERRTVRPWIPLALLFFALGVVIARLVLPFAMTFLLGFTDDRLVANIAAGPYFDFVTTMFLAFGLVMEFPILLVGMSRVGIVTSQRLREARRYVLLGIAIFAAIATPGGDLVSPFVLGGTMYLLYELTIQFIKRTGR
jgi:sec-independent protein translocase protein TatC